MFKHTFRNHDILNSDLIGYKKMIENDYRHD